jgi:methylenetetrahydrofolate/methylenetetrahydromethanopterin dehydrogenase (NADP+)
VAKKNILIQLDGDPHASSFDAVTAIDAGVDVMLPYSDVAPEDVEGIVHGAMFTRGPEDLKHTGIFIGGKNVSRAEELAVAVTRVFFGPLRCSVLMDASGCNTTAAAAVLAANNHLDLSRTKALVLGGTGPVGQRIALLLARNKTAVWVGSRTRDRALDVCNVVKAKYPGAHIQPTAMADAESVAKHPERFNLVIAAGAAGTRLVSREQLASHDKLRLLIDLNAVPPSGLEGVEATDYNREVDGLFQYGAIGVGRLKMKIHKAALRQLFEANDQVLDAEEIFEIAKRLA